MRHKHHYDAALPQCRVQVGESQAALCNFRRRQRVDEWIDADDPVTVLPGEGGGDLHRRTLPEIVYVRLVTETEAGDFCVPMSSDADVSRLSG